MAVLAWTLVGVLTLLLGAAGFYLWKFAKIIMVFEDDLDEGINTLNEVDDKIGDVLNMPMFFDSPEVREKVQEALEEVRLCRGHINGIVDRFTERSKHKYVTVWEDEEPAQEQQIPSLPGQPPGTPNPLEIIRNQGTELNVRGRNQ